MQYAITTENDRSAWRDETGVLYHFPIRYLKFISKAPRLSISLGEKRESPVL